MYLKSLELHGFKSFADRTHLEFHPGVTGIVGPNGCGKSNVVDAVRWVLGETSAKALRGSEMADVIFSGTDKRKPMGLAEVTLTFTDCEESLGTDYAEVAVGRRVYRDGRSEYLLNGTLCRLKDIHNLFMDTGIGRTSYSVMAQGQIDMLLSSKPEDRRVVFEEAAGITKFKKQKKEALRKLEYTEANLLRLTDILAEVKRQMNSLQRQAAKARRYQALLADTRVLDTHLSFRQWTQFSAQKSELETSIASLAKRVAEEEEKLAASESEIDAARLELARIDQRAGEVRQEMNEAHTRARTAEARIAANEERAREWEERIVANRDDIAATEEKLSQQQQDLFAADEALTGLIERIEARRGEAEAAVADAEAVRTRRAEAARDLAAARQAVQAGQGKLASLEAKLENTHNQARTDASRDQALGAEVARVEETVTAQRGELESVTARIDEVAARVTELATENDTADARHRQAVAEVASAGEAVSRIRQALAEKRARLDVLAGLVASGEGLESGAQAVLDGLDDPEFIKSGVRGLLAHGLEVPDDLVAAIGAALGPRLDAVLVADTVLASRIVQTLRDDQRGRAVIAAADLVPDRPEGQMLTVPEGAIGWALDRVKVPGDQRALFEALLRDVLVVPDLDTALRLRGDLPDAVFATTHGELLTPEGMITGGRQPDEVPSILARRNEMRALEEAITGAETELAAAEADQKKGAARVEELAGTLETLRSKAHQATVEKSTLEGQAGLLRRELEQLESRLDQLTWELQEIRQRTGATREGITTLEREIEATRAAVEEGRKKVTEGEADQEALAREEEEAAAKAAELRTALAVEERSRQAMEEQRQPMAVRMDELNTVINRRREEITGTEQRIAAVRQEAEGLRQAIATAEADAKQAEEHLAAFSGQRQEKADLVRQGEEAIRSLRRAVHDLGEQRGREEVQATQVELRLENLAASCRERHGVELAVFEQDVHALHVAIENQRKAMRRRMSRQAAAEDAEPDASGSEAADGGADGETLPASESAEVAADDVPVLPVEDEIDWPFVESVVGELRRRLEGMGPVNLDAITEFEELEERHTFLQNQHDDLTSSKQELLEIIERINKETRLRFAETFEAVRENFTSMFRTLFGERAQANLILTDDSDPLESGIEIIAKPPGKKLQSITLLSGGERSLTAVALLFSIYMVKPSPFCVLDELDAPLDESNIGRFLKVLDTFIDKSQFIIVTHSKRTMARADVMYGVTMEEFGVSKPVGMRLTKDEGGEPAEAETAAGKAAKWIDGEG